MFTLIYVLTLNCVGKCWFLVPFQESPNPPEFRRIFITFGDRCFGFMLVFIIRVILNTKPRGIQERKSIMFIKVQ